MSTHTHAAAANPIVTPSLTHLFIPPEQLAAALRAAFDTLVAIVADKKATLRERRLAATAILRLGARPAPASTPPAAAPRPTNPPSPAPPPPLAPAAANASAQSRGHSVARLRTARCHAPAGKPEGLG